MRKLIYLLLLSLPLNLFALDRDTAFKAMKDEMARAKTELRMKGFDKPYFITYGLEDNAAVNIMASLGALIIDEAPNEKIVYVNMRVGSPEFDNTGFGNPSPSGWYAGDSYDGIRNALWLATDAAYSDALETLSHKKAYKQQRNITDMRPDFSKAPVSNPRDARNTEIFDRAYFENVAKQMSAAGKDFPKFKKFVATVYYLNKQNYYVDSAGSSYYQNPVRIDININAALQTKDGFDITETLILSYASIKDVPPLEELVQKARDFAAKTAAFYDAKKGESYIGPVWLENQTAAVFLNDWFAQEIKNTKPFWKDNDGNDTDVGALTRLSGLRVISNLFDVYDDPSAKEFKGKTLAGYYALDDEGVPGRRVDLVKNGKLVGLLTARSLKENEKASNGHARGGVFNVPREAVSNLFFIPQTTTTDMKAALMAECKRLDLEYCVKVRAFNDAGGFNGYKIFTADGREEPVYGMITSNLTTRSLRDIIYAGNDSAAYHFFPDYNRPYSIIAPSLIVGEFEIKPTDKKPSKPPMVPKP